MLMYKTTDQFQEKLDNDEFEVADITFSPQNELQLVIISDKDKSKMTLQIANPSTQKDSDKDKNLIGLKVKQLFISKVKAVYSRSYVNTELVELKSSDDEENIILFNEQGGQS